jgi:hypothetical protein
MDQSGGDTSLSPQAPAVGGSAALTWAVPPVPAGRKPWCPLSPARRPEREVAPRVLALDRTIAEWENDILAD